MEFFKSLTIKMGSLLCCFGDNQGQNSQENANYDRVIIWAQSLRFTYKYFEMYLFLTYTLGTTETASGWSSWEAHEGKWEEGYSKCRERETSTREKESDGKIRG